MGTNNLVKSFYESYLKIQEEYPTKHLFSDLIEIFLTFIREDVVIPEYLSKFVIDEHKKPDFFNQYEYSIDESSSKQITPEILAYINERESNRRKRGSYYTPNKITSFMVLQALNEYIDDVFNRKYDIKSENLIQTLIRNEKTFEMDKIKLNILKEEILPLLAICDDACGTGAFIIEITNNLFNIYSNIQNIFGKPFSSLEQYKIKSKIVNTNIFGVDVHDDSINIAKARLWFYLYIAWVQASEGDFIDPKFNLMTGNSLIGWDKNKYLTILKNLGKDVDLSNNQLKPFFWKKEFKQVFDQGGFDIIIGNPPYVENKKINPSHKRVYKKLGFKSAYKLYDLSVLFLENALSLLKPGGMLSQILPNKFTVTDYGLRIRNIILNDTEISMVVNVSHLDVFRRVATYPLIIFARKIQSHEEHRSSTHKVRLVPDVKSLDELDDLDRKFWAYPQTSFYSMPKHILLVSKDIAILDRIKEGNVMLLKNLEHTWIYRPFGFTNWPAALKMVENKGNENAFRFIGCTNIFPYRIDWQRKIRIKKRKFSNSWMKITGEFNNLKEQFQKPSIALKEVGKHLTAAYLDGNWAHITGVYGLITSTIGLKFLVGLLNSKLLNFYYHTLYGASHMAGGYLNFHSSYLDQIPIYCPNADEQKLITIIVEYLLYLKQKTLDTSFYESLLNNIIYYCYFREEFNEKLPKEKKYLDLIDLALKIVEKIEFDKWFSQYWASRPQRLEIDEKDTNIIKIEEKIEKIISKVRNVLKKNPGITYCTDLIPSLEYVSKIETNLKKLKAYSV